MAGMRGNILRFFWVLIGETKRQSRKGNGEEMGWKKKLDSARGFANNERKYRIATQFFFNKINFIVGKRQGELALTKT